MLGTLSVLLHLHDKSSHDRNRWGRNGSYFGGLTVVASFVTPDQHDWLKARCGDSKPLDDRKIQQLAPLLEENIQHQALLLSPKKYNEVIASGYKYRVSVKVALHNQAIYLLLNKGVQAERIVIDAFTTAKTTKNMWKLKNQVSQAIDLEEKQKVGI